MRFGNYQAGYVGACYAKKKSPTLKTCWPVILPFFQETLPIGGARVVCRRTRLVP